MRHVPVWFDRFPRSRRPSYPRFKGDAEARVAIVGGGLTGVACALTFASANIDVVLLEADVLGGGITAGAAGFLREGFAGSFRDTATTYGLRITRAMWETLRRGSLDFAAALRRHGVKCDLEARDLITFAARAPEAGRLLRREYEARHEAGVEGSWLTAAALAREAAIESSGGIRTRGAVIDPYRACVGLAAAAVQRGARIHERSGVRRIRAAKGDVEITTAAGRVRAEHVIVATAAPIQDLRALRRHLRADHLYGVVTDTMPAAIRKQTGRREALLEDADAPHRILRWLPDDRALIVGGRQPQLADRFRERGLIQRTGQLMYELSLLYPAISGLPPAGAWDMVDYETVDGLPFVGPHRNFPRHFFAFGSARHGAGLSWASARLALRHVQGEPARADESLGFPRIL